MTQRSRAWCFTINNYTLVDEMHVRDVSAEAEYLICGKEKGDQGTEHLQGYVYFKNARTFNSVKKKIPRAHIEKARGDAKANREYCSKESIWLEEGDMPAQGERVDLYEIRDSIVAGEKVDNIAMEKPHIYHKYGRTLNKLEDLVMRNKFRTEMTTCEWIWGPTGTGKSHRAFEGYTPSTHYVVPDDNGWWDAYAQQDIVILNDFRGWIPYNVLLQLIDKYPMTVKRRGREPMPFTSKHIIITSSLKPEEIYKHRVEEDSIEQLLRRIRVIHLKDKYDTEVVG